MLQCLEAPAGLTLQLRRAGGPARPGQADKRENAALLTRAIDDYLLGLLKQDGSDAVFVNRTTRI